MASLKRKVRICYAVILIETVLAGGAGHAETSADSNTAQLRSSENETRAEQIHKLIDTKDFITANIVEGLFNIKFDKELDDGFGSTEFRYKHSDLQIFFSTSNSGGQTQQKPRLDLATSLQVTDSKNCIELSNIKGWYTDQKFSFGGIDHVGDTQGVWYDFSSPLKDGRVTKLSVEVLYPLGPFHMGTGCASSFLIRQLKRTEG